MNATTAPTLHEPAAIAFCLMDFDARASKQNCGKPSASHPNRLRDFLSDEDGASYILSAAITIPFYTLLICTITECALMMVVKLGTSMAAYSAARAAIVWLPAETDDANKQYMIQLAAAQSMAPFASSKSEHLAPIANAPQLVGNATYHEAFQAWCEPNAANCVEYLSNKRRYALAATNVTIELADKNDATPWRSIRVTVEYEKPIDIPVVGTFLGSRPSWSSASFYSRKIRSTAVLSLEAPKSAIEKLGIRYDSWEE